MNARTRMVMVHRDSVSPAGTAWSKPDNLAIDADGSIYVIEHQDGGKADQDGLKLVHIVASERSREPFSTGSHGVAQVTGQRHAVLFSRHHQGGMQLSLDGGELIAFAFNSSSLEQHELLLGSGLAQQNVRVIGYADGATVAVLAPQGSAHLTEIDALAHAGDGAAEAGRLTAPMPGKLVSFLAAGGDKVSKSQPLAVMEAIKIEYTINAPKDGAVAELLWLKA